MQTGKTEDGSDFVEVQTCQSLLCLHIPKVPFHQTIIVSNTASVLQWTYSNLTSPFEELMAVLKFGLL